MEDRGGGVIHENKLAMDISAYCHINEERQRS